MGVATKLFCHQEVYLHLMQKVPCKNIEYLTFRPVTRFGLLAAVILWDHMEPLGWLAPLLRHEKLNEIMTARV